MKHISAEYIKQSALLFIASLLISLPYFLYSPRQALMATLVLMIFAWAHKALYLIVGIYSILLNTFFLHLVTKWGSNSLVSRIQASYESATYEKWEYFKTYFSAFDIALMLLYIIIALLAVIYVLKKSKFSSLGRTVSLTFSSALIALSLLIFPTMETLKNSQLAHLPYNIYTTTTDLKIIQKREDFLLTTKSVKRSCPNSFDKIIFIQGESANKHHLSLYGYEKETTPFLDSLKTYKFDAIAPANLTRISIPISLTDATVENFQLFYQSKSIVSFLSECGYTSYWISNQGKTGEYETTITSIAKEANHTYFLNDLDYTTAGLDGNVLKPLEEIKTKGSEKQAFFFHLLGSHFSYAERYPADKYFSDEEDTTTQYDNSIRYTDSVISDIYKQYNNENALYIYSSDHSEAVKTAGHGFSPSLKEEYEIPLVFWSKQETKLKELTKEINAKTINTESLNNIIKYLVGAEDKPNISYSQKVISIIPKTVVDYSTLKSEADD